jgi:ribosomal-protein-alanine acetyltransferase
MPIIIEDASIRHLDELSSIETECFKQEAFTKQQIAHLLTDYNCVGIIAKEDSHIVGFCIASVYYERSSIVGHLLTIDVLPACRRKEIGARLLREIEGLLRNKGAKSMYLEVREDNAAAIALYQKIGYSSIGKLRNYYGNSHGIYMGKQLT